MSGRRFPGRAMHGLAKAFCCKRALESVPFRMVLALLVVAALLYVGFFQVSTFLDFSSRKQFADSMNGVESAMASLSSGDYGSFTRVHVSVPEGYSVSFSNSSNLIEATLPDGQAFLSIPGRFCNFVFLDSGEYTITLYYGPRDASELKPYTVCFS